MRQCCNVTPELHRVYRATGVKAPLSADTCKVQAGKTTGQSTCTRKRWLNGAEVIFLLLELYLQWQNSPKTITVLLTVSLTRRCSVYFRAMCCGAVIHIIVGQTNGSALFKLTDIFNYSVGAFASSMSGH